MKKQREKKKRSLHMNEFEASLGLHGEENGWCFGKKL